MKIIQLNIWGGKLGHQVISFLKDENPDLVCMQEVNDLKGRSGYKFFATLNEIKKEAGFDEAFMSPTYSARYMERELAYGNAILSRLPFKSTETIFTHREYVRNFDVERDGGNIRNLQIVSVETGGKTLNVLNHHGYHLKGTKQGDENTMKAAKTIAAEIRRLKGPVIMCGDFNLSPHSESLEVINKELDNLSIRNGLKRTYTKLSIINEVCDYIFVNDQVRVKRFRISDELVSDHKALILEFEL